MSSATSAKTAWKAAAFATSHGASSPSRVQSGEKHAFTMAPQVQGARERKVLSQTLLMEQAWFFVGCVGPLKVSAHTTVGHIASAPEEIVAANVGTKRNQACPRQNQVEPRANQAPKKHTSWVQKLCHPANGRAYLTKSEASETKLGTKLSQVEPRRNQAPKNTQVGCKNCVILQMAVFISPSLNQV